MNEDQTANEKTQPGWKVALGIGGFIVGLVALLILLKMLIG